MPLVNLNFLFSIRRFNPPGHWYEVPNLLKNGVLGQVLKDYPNVTTLMLHNIDTLGVSVDPIALGYHLRSKNVLTFEVVPRRINDKGGGLAKVDGHIRLLEGIIKKIP
jgi:UDP-N-acetylglucosamine pyrophosphorylase